MKFGFDSRWVHANFFETKENQKDFLGPKNQGVFRKTSLNKKITSEIKNFWDFNSNEIEVFPRKVKLKSKNSQTQNHTQNKSIINKMETPTIKLTIKYTPHKADENTEPLGESIEIKWEVSPSLKGKAEAFRPYYDEYLKTLRPYVDLSRAKSGKLELTAEY